MKWETDETEEVSARWTMSTASKIDRCWKGETSYRDEVIVFVKALTDLLGDASKEKAPVVGRVSFCLDY